ncbi:MAG: STAS domain-containing protein [Geodermatophilales bacterium]|nr:STAS domain-containing protein [Geodermatophilales bacterium]
MTIDISGAAPYVRLTAAGEIDSSSAPVLRQHLETVLDTEVTEITVDLSGVTFLDSAGLCVLAAAYRRAAEQDTHLRVLASSRAVIRPLQITGLFDLLQVERVDAGPVVA